MNILNRLMYIFIITVLFSSCNNFLDTVNYTKKDTSNFPKTLSDAQQMLTGIYSIFSLITTNPASSSFMVSELASDDRYGGGGQNDKQAQAIDFLMEYPTNMFADFWAASYKGVFRTNMALETLDNCTGWESDAQKNQFKGEVYFLRAMFYFQLSETFGEVPLVLSTSAQNIAKSPAEDTYAQIASDLKQAITLMESVPYSQIASGHATKWAAEALMARVFLFYTGYYKKDILPLKNDNNGITKNEVEAWLSDCIVNSGHGLISDFRNLWSYTNQYTAKDYDYDKKNNLVWAGDGNKEEVFAVKYGTSVDWGAVYEQGYSNQYDLYFGLRSTNGGTVTFPFGQGWGFGPVNPNFMKDWKAAEPTDTLRRNGSVIDVNKDLPNYVWGGDKQMEETGYWQKKYIPISAYDNGTWVASYAVLQDGAKNDYQVGHTNDLVLIRYADVLLMQSELMGDAKYMNEVRARVGLNPVAYSLQALKNERRWELAFEGVRYYDLMRWGDAADALAKQQDVNVKNNNVQTSVHAIGGGYKSRYEATGGFFPIPETQISLSNGVLKQNKGWGTPDTQYTGW